jgi:hypothetical protein
MANVTHSLIDCNLKYYKGKMLENWAQHSQLINLIRTVHQEFMKEPPIPIKKQSQNQSQPVAQPGDQEASG